MKRIYTKWYDHEWRVYHWKTLCVVFDNESLGVLERMLLAQGFEYKTENVEKPGEQGRTR